MESLVPIPDLENGEAEAGLNHLGDSLLQRCELLSIHISPVSLPVHTSGKINFPLLEKWISVPLEQRTPDVLPEDASVLVPVKEMLLEAAP